MKEAIPSGTGYGMHRHGGTTHRLYHLLQHKQDLALTDEQVTKLKGLSLDQDRARIKAHADVIIAGRELRSLVSDDKAELSVIEAKSEMNRKHWKASCV